MKKTLFFLVWLCMGLLGLAQGPVAHYQMTGGSLVDASGNGNNGVAVGGASPVPGGFFTGTGGTFLTESYAFDGVNDYIRLANNSNFQLTSFPISVSAWVNLSSNTTVDNVFRNCFVSGRYHGIIFNIVQGKVGIGYGDGGTAGPSNRRSKLGTTVLNPGPWYHIAAVIRGPQDMSIYVNGREDCGNYSGTGGPIAYTTADGNIGQGTANSATNFFGGKMDEVRLYDRELTQEELMVQINPFFSNYPFDILCGVSVPLFTGYGEGHLVSHEWTEAPNWGTLSCTSCATPLATPLADPTTYTLVTENKAGCKDTFEISGTVMGPCCDAFTQTAGFTWSHTGSGGPLYFSSNSTSTFPGGISLMVWDFGDGVTSYVPQSPIPATNVVHTYATPGPYTVCLTIYDASEDCYETACQTVYSPARLGQALPAWSLTPNPAKDYVEIDVPQQLQTTAVEIIDLKGQLVLQRTITPGLSNKISIKGLSPGIYLVKLKRVEQTQKLLVR